MPPTTPEPAPDPDGASAAAPVLPTSNGNGHHKPAPKKPAEPPGFAAWWAAYPGPRKTSRKDALARYARAVAAHGEERLASGLAAWAACHDWTKDGGQFVPNPVTFLNREQFLESPPANGCHPRPAHLANEPPGNWDRSLWDAEEGREQEF